MYNLHVKNKKTKEKKKQKQIIKMANSFCSSWKIVQFTNESSTETFYTPQFGFRQAEKNKTKQQKKHISYHKVKNHDVKTFKKEKQRNPLKREVI